MRSEVSVEKTVAFMLANVRCQAATSKGTQCTYRASQKSMDNYFCGTHAKQSQASFPITDKQRRALEWARLEEREDDARFQKEQAEEQAQIVELVDRWSWRDVYRAWTRHISEFDIDPENLFVDVTVFDPASPEGKEAMNTWWPRKEIRNRQIGIQRHCDAFPGLLPPHFFTPHQYCVGSLDTADFLREVQGVPERTAAVLVSASLFSRLGSSRRGYPRRWPDILLSETLAEWARSATGAEYPGWRWNHTCTRVIPMERSNHRRGIETMGDLVEFLADEHAQLLTKYAPVSVQFQTKPDPFVNSILKAEYEKKHRSRLEWRLNLEKKEAAAQEEHRQRKLKHPRCDDWRTLKREELQRLVWTKPIIELAKEFGISDVAINKRCKRDGIRKPRQGFWLKVKAGTVPHPNGFPNKNG